MWVQILLLQFMTIVYKKGDVLDSDESVIVHGCNCFNTMGSGIARQIRKQYPKAYNIDQKTVRGDISKLGTFTHSLNENMNGDAVFVVNAYTQHRYGRDKVYADYDAIEDVFVKICEWFPHKVIALPKIGCGLAGGSWEVVSEILERVSEQFDKTFHVYEWKTGSVEREPRKV